MFSTSGLMLLPTTGAQTCPVSTAVGMQEICLWDSSSKQYTQRRTRHCAGGCCCSVCCLVSAADALLVWGWRIPFLIAITTLIAATILRYNMPGGCRCTATHSAAAVHATCMHRLLLFLTALTLYV